MDLTSKIPYADENGNWVIPKTAGVGMKVDLTTPTFGFRDMLGDVFTRNTGASKPSFAVYRGGLRDYQFAAGKEEYFKYHVPHDYAPNTNIFIHIHWSHIGTLVTGGSVTFEYEASYSKAYAQDVFNVPINDTVIGNASVVQYQQILTEQQMSAIELSATQLDASLFEPDGIIILRAGVNANNITVSGGGVPDPFIHYVDIHYQTTNMGTKDKNVNFYI